jgi:hypothetical protein
MRRLAITVLLAVAACDSKSDKQQLPPSTQDVKPVASAFAGELPKVDDGGAVVPLDKLEPGRVVVVNADGTMTETVTHGDTWPTQIAGQQPITIDRLREQMFAETKPTMPHEDPPPEDIDEDGSGTAMALEEGKMTKPSENDQLARDRSIEAAREAGLLGSGAASGSLASAHGVPVGATPESSPMVFADPRAKATALVDVLSINGGVIAVRRAGTVGFFRVGFATVGPGGTLSGGFGTPMEEVWVEAHIESAALHLLVGGVDKRFEIPLAGGKVDFAQLASRLDEIKKMPQFAKVDLAVDVLAHGDTTVQELVDVLVAVDAARVKPRIGTSPTPAADRSLQNRYGTIGGGGFGYNDGSGGSIGRPTDLPTVAIGQPLATGDLDKAIIRRYIKRHINKISYCYEKVLLEKPGLKGTVSAQFLISVTGTVTSATASGVDDEVASCVAGVIKNIEFPKPKDGGVVQVNYPFTFRPAGE